MRSSMRLLMFCSLLIGLSALTAAPAMAQSPEGETSMTKPKEVRLYRLEHAACRDMAGMIIQMIGNAGDVIPDDRTNSLLVIAPIEVLAKVERLITQLDIPADAVDESVRILLVKNRDVDQLATQIPALMPMETRRGSRVVADRARRALLVSGSRNYQASIEELVAALDVMPQQGQFQLNFAFFFTSQDAGSDVNVPDDLKSVSKEIAKLGNVQYVGRLTTAAVEGTSGFSVSGGIGKNTMLEISGSAPVLQTDGTMRLEITAQATISRKLEKEPVGNPMQVAQMTAERAPFMVQTTVLIRDGQTVVIGSSPLGFKEGEAVILVLQVQAR